LLADIQSLLNLVSFQAQFPRRHLTIGELLHPVSQGKNHKPGGVELFIQGQMKVSGDQALTTLFTDGTGKGADNIPVVPTPEIGLITGTAGALQAFPDPQRKRWRYIVERQGRQTVVQEQAQQAIGPVATVDLISMTEKQPTTLHCHDSWSAVDISSELLVENRPHVKIMIALEIHQSTAAVHQCLKRIQHFIILPERVGGKAQPEIEQVTHNVQGFRVAFQLMKKPQQKAVIGLIRSSQMGIGKKDRTHGRDCAVTPRRCQ